MSGKTPSAHKMAVQTSLILVLFTAVFTAFLSGAFSLTEDYIKAANDGEKLAAITAVLPQSLYNNDLLHDRLQLPATPELGQTDVSSVYRARYNGQPVALALEVVAPDGYAGKIHLIVGVHQDGHLIGVRPVAHKETPGLGDYIDPKKDRNKQSPWIAQFPGLALDNREDAQWRVHKDGGSFAFRAGATISPRAVIKAVHKALHFVRSNTQRLYAEEGKKP